MARYANARCSGVAALFVGLLAAAACSTTPPDTKPSPPEQTTQPEGIVVGEVAESSEQHEDTVQVEAGSVSTADLDQALLALVECMKPTLHGEIRVNFSRYIDFSADYGFSDGRNDAEAVNRIWEDCNRTSGFLEKDFAYRRSNPLTVEQLREIAREFQTCAETAGFKPSDYGPVDDIADTADLFMWRESIYMKTPEPARKELHACGATVFYGPPLNF